MCDKKLSIIVPIYNVANFVPKAAESIVSQAFDGLEVVLIDDGSTDDSLNIFKNHLSGLDVVTSVQENAGQSVARNNGMKLARGEYLLFLDADDFLLPGALANIMDLIERESPDVIFGRYLRWSPQTGYLKGKAFEYNPPEDKLKRTEYILGALPEPSWSVCRYIVSNKLVCRHSLHFEAGKLCEDVKWAVYLLDAADTVSFLPDPFYGYYYARSNSTMNSASTKRLLNLNEIVADLIANNKNRTGLCTPLVHQSFLYINEYCVFDKQARKQVFDSYKRVLPLYKQSGSLIHRIGGKCTRVIPFSILARVLNIAKSMRRFVRDRKTEPGTIDLKAQHQMSLAALKVIDEICKKHDITYFLIAGTLLGAVRHKGFIPWDDDIDIGMTMDEYEKFSKICQKNLPHGYFYSTTETNRLHSRFFGKILYNDEQCLDVLTIARVPDNPTSRRIHRIMLKFLYAAYQYKLGESLNIQSRGIKKILIPMLVWPISVLMTRKALLKAAQHITFKYERQQTTHYMNVNGRYSLEQDLIKSEWIDDLTPIFFEDSFFPAFTDFDAYLSHVYGDYMRLPPPGERLPFHQNVTIRIQKTGVQK